MIKKYFSWVAIAAATLLVGVSSSACSDDDNNGGGDGGEKPSVKITTGAVTHNSISFTIETENAEKAFYVVRPSSESAPTVKKVLEEGTAIDVTKENELTESDLAASTEYKIYAAAVNGDINSSLAIGTMTTSRTPAQNYDVTFKTVKDAIYVVLDATAGTANYSLALATGEWNNQGYPTDQDGFILEINFVDVISTDGSMILSAGEYKGSSSLEAGTFATGQNTIIKTAEGKDYVAGGTVLVAYAGGVYTLTGKLNDVNGNTYDINYEGAIAFDIERWSDIDFSPSINDIKAESGYAGYTGYSGATATNLSDYYIQVVDEENYQAFTLGLRVAGTGFRKEIPVGTYTVGMEEKEFVCLIAGMQYTSGNTYNYINSWWLQTEPSETGFNVIQQAPIASGTVKVAKDGDKYTFTLDAADDAKVPNKITGSWTGTLNFVDETKEQAPARLIAR